MAYRHFTLTLATTAATLYSLIGATTAHTIGIVSQLSIQPDGANVAEVKGGSVTDTVTTTNYGWVLPIPVDSIPCAPYPIEANKGIISLANVQVLGGNISDKIHVSLVLP